MRTHLFVARPSTPNPGQSGQLPLRALACVHTGTAIPLPAAASHPEPRVLIIDDDALTTEHFSRMLRLEGYKVETALDAETGFRAAVNGGFDAVILDLRMPLVDGLEVLRQLRKAPSSHDTPVAIVTGDYMIDDATVAELHQFGAILRYKPLWLEDLTELTRTLVGRDFTPLAPRAKTHVPDTEHGIM